MCLAIPQRFYETAEFPFSLAQADRSGDNVIIFLVVNTGAWAAARKVMDGIRYGNTFGFRIATAGGKPAVVGSIKTDGSDIRVLN